MAGFGDPERMLDVMPPAVVERMGRMTALARRAVLAYLDEDAATLAAVTARIGSWDDDPGRRAYPMPRYQFASKQNLQLANWSFDAADRLGITVTNAQAAEGASDLVARLAPEQHRAEAAAVLTAMTDDYHGGAEFDPAAGDGAPGFLAFSATAAFLAAHPRLQPSRHSARLQLIKQIRDSEAVAARVPPSERVTEISDQEALDLLRHRIADPDFPMPLDPRNRDVWQLDVLAVVKEHLLRVPADAITEQHLEELRERIAALLQAAAGTSRGFTAPGKSSGPRNQPKRKQPRSKR